jgi:hypothetical protein
MMYRPFRLEERPRRWRALLALGCAAAAAGALETVACVIAPPPDLPVPPIHRPTILHDAVLPPADVVLTQLPAQGFVVPVLLEDPNESFCSRVFVDFDPYNNPAALFPECQGPTPQTANGGVVLVDFSLDSVTLDPSFCHRIEFLVAAEFNEASPHTPTSIGGDSVTWLYNAAGGDGCPLYDAGALGDAGFSMPDAPIDGLPIAPESGGDP